MSTLTKVILAIVVVAGIATGGYFYLSGGPEITETIENPQGVVLELSGESSEYQEAVEIGKQVAASLETLRAVRMDTEFFKNDLFLSLRNRSYTVIHPEDEEIGRTNPFAPIDPSASVEIRPSEEELEERYGTDETTDSEEGETTIEE